MKNQIKRAAVLILAAVMTAAASGCSRDTAETEDEPVITDVKEHVHTYEKEGYTYMQLIPDSTFKTGMNIISQRDHENGNATHVVGTHSFYEGIGAENAKWQLAQWDSGPDLEDCMIDAGASEITDGYARSFKYDSEDDIMTFRQDTSIYYNGSAAVQGDYWPHLLIEQGTFNVSSLTDEEKKYYSCGASKIILTADIRLEDYNITENSGDWVEAEQFLLYFYVKNVNNGDFCWFGVQLFDNRWALNDNYIGYDGGKADASGAMIYSIGSKYVYTGKNLWSSDAPSPSASWVHIEIDIKPYLDEMFLKGRSEGYFKTTSIYDLYIDGMNLGWETIGTFDSTMSVRNLRLTSYLPEVS